MSGAPKWLWTIPLATALPAPAAAQGVDLCASFQRMIAAAHEATPFASVREALARGEDIIPGFPAAACRVEDESVTCGAWAMSIRAFDNWPDPIICPGLSAARPRHRSARVAGPAIGNASTGAAACCSNMASVARPAPARPPAASR